MIFWILCLRLGAFWCNAENVLKVFINKNKLAKIIIDFFIGMKYSNYQQWEKNHNVYREYKKDLGNSYINIV